MHPNQDIKDILRRVNNGQSSADDRQKLNSWYNEYDDSQSIIDRETDAISLKNAIWNKISTKAFRPSIVKRRNWYIGSAAALLLLFGITLYQQWRSDYTTFSTGVSFLDESGNKNSVQFSENDFLDSTKYVDLTNKDLYASVRLLHTKHGEFIKVVLPDGSKVSMNSNTKIQLKKDFGIEGNRIVYLDGEAYFDVKKDAQKKFIVRTKDQSIEVLGTKFNVKSYSDQIETVTSLYEGKIQLEKDNQKVFLRPNQLVTNNGEQLNILTKDLKVTSMWRSMRFSFDDAPVQDVINQLSNWYGFVVGYQNEIPDLRISGELEPGMKLKDVLRVLENLTQAKCELINNKLTVQFLK